MGVAAVANVGVPLAGVDESDCVKLLRRSSFSRVRSPSILAFLGGAMVEKSVARWYRCTGR